jgi:hypothetical protein
MKNILFSNSEEFASYVTDWTIRNPEIIPSIVMTMNKMRQGDFNICYLCGEPSKFIGLLSLEKDIKYEDMYGVSPERVFYAICSDCKLDKNIPEEISNKVELMSKCMRAQNN